MEFWNNVIHAALLGTDKRQLNQHDLPEDLAVIADEVEKQAPDKESRFLALASLTFNYRKCGVQPFHKAVPIMKAEAEEKCYCNPLAQQLLNDIVSTESYPLLKWGLELCAENNNIVKPEWVPLYLDLGIKYQELQGVLSAVTGKRGAWLLQFNEMWTMARKADDDLLWESGTLEERKHFLKILSTGNPARARALVQQVWATEHANARTELLKSLSQTITGEDLPWLEQLQNEKSQKVKDEALRLLKLCPQSSIVKAYWKILQQSIQVKREKGLLGFGSKTILSMELVPDIDDRIFKSGIEKFSTDKNANDDDFILFQLLAAVPPSFLEQHFQMDKQAILDVFLKSKNGKSLVPAFGTAALVFKDLDWFRAVIAALENQFYPGAFELLPAEDQEKYALRFLGHGEHAAVVVSNLGHFTHEWSLAFTRELFRFTIKNQYAYNRSFYSQHILHIPVAIIPALNDFSVEESYQKDMWTKTSEYMVWLLTLKTQTQNAFKS